jgi:hypothetical protein
MFQLNEGGLCSAAEITQDCMVFEKQ